MMKNNNEVIVNVCVAEVKCPVNLSESSRVLPETKQADLGSRWLVGFGQRANEMFRGVLKRRWRPNRYTNASSKKGIELCATCYLWRRTTCLRNGGAVFPMSDRTEEYLTQQKVDSMNKEGYVMNGHAHGFKRKQKQILT